MNLEEIKDIILQSIEGENLVLHEAQLEAEIHNGLFSTYLDTEELTIAGAEVVPSADRLLVRGHASFLEMESIPTELSFEEVDGEVDLRLAASLPEAWLIPASFPALSLPVLFLLDSSESTLVLSSPDRQNGSEAGASQAGFRLESQVAPNAVLSPLSMLLDESVKLPMHGTISINESIASVDLTLDIPFDLAIGEVSTENLHIKMTGPQVSEWSGREEMVSTLNGRLVLGSHTIDFSTVLPNGAPVLSLTVTPEDVVLSDIADLAELVPGIDVDVSLPEGFPELSQYQLHQLDLTFDLSAEELVWLSASLNISESWQAIPGELSFSNPILTLQLNQSLDKQTWETRVIIGGEATVKGIPVDASLSVPDFVLYADVDQIELGEILRLVDTQAQIPENLAGFTLNDVSLELDTTSKIMALSGHGSAPLETPIGINGIEISDVSFDLRADPSKQGPEVISGTMSGVFSIGAASFEVIYNFPGDFILTGDIPTISLSLLLQEFCGGDIVRDLPLPVSILEAELHNAQFTVAPEQRALSFAGDTPLGKAEIVIDQTESGSWGFSIGFVPPESWNLSAIDPALSVLDDLDFSGSTLIVASSEDSSLALTTIELPQGYVNVHRGLNFFAGLGTSALGVIEVLPGFDLDRLQVYAAIGNDPRNLVIEAAIEGRFQIDESTAFGDITFRLKPSPSDFEVTLLGTVTTVIDENPLLFIGGLGVTAPPPAGQISATMVGTWDNPFGTHNLSISNVGLELRLPPPSIGIIGALRIGDFEGKAAVSLNVANPMQSMLAVQFEELKLVQLFDAFCPPQARQAIPGDLVTTILDVEFEDVKIYIVPQSTTIAGVDFEQGIRLQGRMIFWGLMADGRLLIDQGSGILVEGDIDDVVLGSIFKLTAVAGKEKASLLADLRLGKPTRIDINGAVELLGFHRELTISISDSGFRFTTSDKIFDLFEASLVVSGGDMLNGDGIMVKATMRDDLFDYLSDKASEAIESAAKQAAREIEDAQRAVNRAQVDVDKLDSSIKTMQQTIQREREEDAKRLRDAQNAIQREQNKVNSLNQQIRNMRSTIQHERDRDAANLRNARQNVLKAEDKVNGLTRQISTMRLTVQAERDREAANRRRAQSDLDKAQKEVNKIQRDINATKKQIDEINKQIAAKKRWLDSKPWVHKVWAGPEYAAFESAKRVEQGALYTKISGLEAAKHSALVVLEAAKRTLRAIDRTAKIFPIDADPRVSALIAARETARSALKTAKSVLINLERASKTFPIEADPRMVGLFAARDTANGALKLANLALKGIEAGIKTFPIDSDPRLISLFSARATALGALEVAGFALEGVKQSVKGVAAVGQFIADGAGKLLVINEAMFEASLSAAHGGNVSMAVKLVFMDEPRDLAFDFNFHDPLSSAKGLADWLLPG